jgi:thiamine biosynthesis lipoprotein
MPATLSFEAIGCAWTIDLPESLARARLAQLRAAVLDRIGEFDLAYSRFRSDSLVARMSRRAGTYELPPDAAPLMEHYRALYQLTGGRVTPLVGSLMAEAGYDASYSLEPRELHAPPAWDAVLSYEPPSLTLSRPALLDFGAAGKGYIVDLVGQLLEAEGVRAFTIDASGDILHRGPNLRVGLEHPLDPTRAIGVVEVANASICGSATNRRKWGSMHHIMDPITVGPVRNISATWAIADTALVADGLATALFFVPPEALSGTFQFEYVIMYTDGSVRWSDSLPGEVFAT